MVVVPIILLVFLLITPLVYNFIPQYKGGIEYAKLSLWGGLGYIFVGPSVILGVLKKNLVNFILLSLLSVTTYGLYFMNMIHFDSINQLIRFKNMLFIGYSAVMLGFVYFVIRKKK